MANESHIIFNFFVEHMIPEMPSLYGNCIMAVNNYLYKENYKLTTEDKINLITYMSHQSAVLRKAWRIYVETLGYSQHSFWDGYIHYSAICNMLLSITEMYADLLKKDEEFTKLIARTHDPEFINKLFSGLDKGWLFEKLSLKEDKEKKC